MTEINMRTVERFDLELPAFMQIANQKENESIELVTSDVCSGGAFFHTRKSMPVGTEVKVDLVLSVSQLQKIETERVTVQTAGAVVRTDAEGIAVRFSKKYKITPFGRS
jgi:hypothetical protein